MLKRIFYLLSISLLFTFIACDETNQDFPNLVQFGQKGGTYIVSGSFGGSIEITDFYGNVFATACYDQDAEEQTPVTVDWLEITPISWTSIKLTATPMNGSRTRRLYLDASMDHWPVNIEVIQTCQY